MRLPLVLAAVVAVLAGSAVPAFAGEDGDPAPTPPPVQPTPVPVQPTPVPVQPTPAPTVQPPTKSQRESELERALAREKRTNQALEKRLAGAGKKQVKSSTAVVQHTPVVAQRVQAVRTVQTVPSGGIQAGAGGTALQSSTRPPLALAVTGLLLALLALGGALRLAQVRSRR